MIVKDERETKGPTAFMPSGRWSRIVRSSIRPTHWPPCSETMSSDTGTFQGSDLRVTRP